MSRKWIVGLVVLGLLMMSLSALAAAPKVYRGDSDKLQINTQARMADMKAKGGSEKPSKESLKSGGFQKMTPEAYAFAGYGFSEGWADCIATNGNVVVWSNDTLLGNYSFAPANDLAHPTAYYVGYGTARVRPMTMQFYGNYLYVNGYSDIYVWDCTDVNDIQFVADFDLSCYLYDPNMGTNNISDFRVKNGYLYMAMAYRGFLIYDIGNPSFPVMVGTPEHAAINRGLYAFDFNGDWWMWADRVEVTDDTMILVDTYGYVYCWDITNMVDPINTVVPYPGGAVFGNYIDPLTPIPSEWVALVTDFDIGLPYFDSVNQVTYVSGWLFLGNSGFSGYAGVTRLDWADESNPDTLLNLYGAGWSINDGFTGRARYINNFTVIGTGSFCFVAYDEQRDPGPPFGPPDIIGDAGEKWDWSVWNAPVSLLVYKMDRFFFNDTTKFNSPILGYNYFYGGAQIAFYAPSYGSFRTFIAGYNYVASFDDYGMMVDHYTVGIDPQVWPIFMYSQPLYKLPAGSSAFNFTIASDDSSCCTGCPRAWSFRTPPPGTAWASGNARAAPTSCATLPSPATTITHWSPAAAWAWSRWTSLT